MRLFSTLARVDRACMCTSGALAFRSHEETIWLDWFDFKNDQKEAGLNKKINSIPI